MDLQDLIQLVKLSSRSPYLLNHPTIHPPKLEFLKNESWYFIRTECETGTQSYREKNEPEELAQTLHTLPATFTEKHEKADSCWQLPEN